MAPKIKSSPNHNPHCVETPKCFSAASCQNGLTLFSYTTTDPRLRLIRIKVKGLVLGWPLKPFEKHWYIGSLIKAIRENIKYPKGLRSVLGTDWSQNRSRNKICQKHPMCSGSAANMRVAKSCGASFAYVFLSKARSTI